MMELPFVGLGKKPVLRQNPETYDSFPSDCGMDADEYTVVFSIKQEYFTVRTQEAEIRLASLYITLQ
jgi:hypothetical protein